MLNTPNYALKKPEGTDVVDIANFNDNADIIDTQLKSLNTNKANLASPTFTGTPLAPTAAAGTVTTQLATTAFVGTAITNKTSVTGNAGTATKWATARTVTLAGYITGSASIDGSANVTITTTSDMTQTSKTYAQLATMVTNKTLVPGAQYILTDYATKYQQPDTLTIKTGAVEQLVLTATSTSTFNVICSSLTYPQDIIYYQFNLNLCEDDTTARNGFILRRIDESPHVCIDAPLDWRTMLWARWLPNQTQYLLGTTLTNYATWTSGAVTLNTVYKAGNAIYVVWNEGTPTSATDTNYFKLVYEDITKGMLLSNLKIGHTGQVEIILQKSSTYKEYLTFGTSCTRITFQETVYGDWGSTPYLPNNVFADGCECFNFGSSCRRNTFDHNCSDMTFGSECNENTFQNSCTGFTFGALCDGNVFGANSVHMTFGSNCGGNIAMGIGESSFGSSCFNNYFGHDCWSNTFASYCNNNKCGHGFIGNSFLGACAFNVFIKTNLNNTFGSNSNYNEFGTNNLYNDLGSGCSNNKFILNCSYNNFGVACSSNTFSNGCQQNTFGSNCNTNTFGASCCWNYFGPNCYQNTLGEGCGNINFSSSCYLNTLGAGCVSDTFGANCFSNSFGLACNINTFGAGLIGNTFGNYKCNFITKYLRYKNMSALTALENRDYTTTFEKKNNYPLVYWSLDVNNTPVYTTLA